jgi:hypothetical protein
MHLPVRPHVPAWQSFLFVWLVARLVRVRVRWGEDLWAERMVGVAVAVEKFAVEVGALLLCRRWRP